jgi:hypothetical protein
LKDELKAKLKVKDTKKAELCHQAKIYKKEQKINEAEIMKLQAALNKETASLSSSRMNYAATHRNVDTLGEVIKELNSELKKLKKFKMTSPWPSLSTMMQELQCEKYIYKCKKDKEVTKRTNLEAKNVHTMLTHSL